MSHIRFANPERDMPHVSKYSKGVMLDIMKASGISTLVITSTARTAHDQAKIMYHNIERHGVEKQKRLYASAGDKIIDIYVTLKASGKTKSQIISGMTRKINTIGPRHVSRHAGDPSKLNVVDIAPSSIPAASAHKFETAVAAEKRVSKFLLPPTDPSYHLEIPQQKGRE